VKRAIGRALKAEIYPVDNNTPTETVIDYTDRLFLQDVWKRLSAEEKKVIRMYYFLEMTEQQIADKINLGQQRVSQIINQAIDKMGSE
jgi:RNA polymerase sigma factor (sigma-70 family)